MRRWFSVIACVMAVSTASAKSETTRMLDAQRITFRDLVPEATGALAAIDLGAAPPPGGSRLFSADDLRTAIVLSRTNAENVPIPASVRVVRVTRRFSEGELDVLIRPSLSALLPPGATIVAIQLPRSVLTVPQVSVGDIRMPRLPKRVGLTRTSAVAELVVGGDVLTRVPLTMDVRLDERATRYLLERGAPLNLVIDTGLTRVTAAAVVQSPADLGDVVPCQVSRTRKILRAKIISSREAVVVQQ